MKKIIFLLYFSVILSLPGYSSENGNFILELIFSSIEKKVNDLFNEEPFAVSKKS